MLTITLSAIKKMNRREKLVYSRKKAKLSQAALAKKMGVTQPYIAAIEKSGNFSYEQACIIANILGADENWLFFEIDEAAERKKEIDRLIKEHIDNGDITLRDDGTFSMDQTILTKLEEKSMAIGEDLAQFSLNIKNRPKDTYAQLVRNEIERDNNKPNAIPFNGNTNISNMYYVPVKAYGGFLTGYESPVFLNSLTKSPFPFIKGECFAFEVDGFSMYKEYVPGDWVVTTPVENFEWLSKGKVYVFQTVDGIILKCFDRIEGEFLYLHSLNEEYNPVKPIHLKDVKKIYFKEKVIKN